MAQDVRRGSFVVIFGSGDERWQLVDPGHPRVSEAQHRVRYSKPIDDMGEADYDALILVSIASDMEFLVHTCPTTKLACEKLAAMRAAVRKLGPVDEDKAAE